MNILFDDEMYNRNSNALVWGYVKKIGFVLFCYMFERGACLLM